MAQITLVRPERTEPRTARLRRSKQPALFQQAGEGFENKLAELVAGQTAMIRWPTPGGRHRRGFIRNTLKAANCDAVMAAPVGYDLVEATQPYYRSTYVFVSRADRHLDIASMKDSTAAKSSNRRASDRR